MKKIILDIFFIALMIYIVSITFFEKQNIILASVIVVIIKFFLEFVINGYKKWKQ